MLDPPYFPLPLLSSTFILNCVFFSIFLFFFSFSSSSSLFRFPSLSFPSFLIYISFIFLFPVISLSSVFLVFLFPHFFSFHFVAISKFPFLPNFSPFETSVIYFPFSCYFSLFHFSFSPFSLFFLSFLALSLFRFLSLSVSHFSPF